MAINSSLLNYKPIQKLIKGIGNEVLKYVGPDKIAVIGLQDDGVFYGEGLSLWLKQKGKDVSFTTMDDEGDGLEAVQVRGRKVLVVDNYIITGSGYQKVMKRLNSLKKKLGIKDIKFAALCDRRNLADFSVEGFAGNIEDDFVVRLDNIDFKILRVLTKDGRKPLSEIAGEIKLTSAAVKKRVTRLIKKGIIEIQGLLTVSKFCSVSALIQAETSAEGAESLIQKLKDNPNVFYLTRLYSPYNVVIGILAPNIKKINELAEKEIRQDPEVKNIIVSLGELPTVPYSVSKILFIK